MNTYQKIQWLAWMITGLSIMGIGMCYGFSQENNSASMKLENAAFNADGTTLTFSVTLPGDQIWMGNVVHEKGTYQITADVATGACRAVKTA